MSSPASLLSAPLTETPTASAQISFLEEGDADIIASLYETPLGEQAFSAINSRTFDKTGSAGLYARTFGDEWYKKSHQLLLMIGCDGGLMLRYLEQVAKGDGRRVLIIELPEMIAWLNEHVDYDHDFVELIPANGDLSVLSGEKYNGYLFRNAVGIHRSLATLDQFHPAYERLWVEYEKLIHRFFFANMVEIHGSSGFVNAQLLNLADNKHSIHHLYHQFDGGVAVLLAGGPSLDQAIDWVKENRHRITLFAVGRVCGRLKKEGIDPDFIGAVDPNEISFDNSKQLLQHYENSTFLHAYHVNPRLLSQFRGHSFYHGKRYPWFKVEPDVNEQFTAPGPTITNTLLSFMVHFGFEHIIFAGVDMCHKSDGQSHESGSLESQVGRFVGTYRATQFVTTNAGRLASTTPDLFSAHQVLQVQVAALCTHFKNLTFYNPSPDAAVVEGVSFIPWQSLELPAWDNQAPAIVGKIIDKLRFNAEKFLKASRKEVQRMRRCLSDAEKSAVAGLKATKVLFDSDTKTLKASEKVNQSRQKIEKALADDAAMLIDYAPAAFHDTLTVDVTQKQENKDIQQSLTYYFEAIQKSSKQLISVIDSCQELIDLRLRERQEAILSVELVRGWIRYGQPGRLYVWLDSHQRGIEDLSEAENALAYPLVRAFDAIFKVTETGIVKKFKASVYDNTLDEVLKSMQQVDESSIDKLDEVLAFCEAQAEQDDFYRSLGLFILGYFNSLRGQLDDAYDAWDMVDHNKLREQAQISALTLSLSQRDYHRALGVLERLCVKQHAYLTIYANVLVTLGQQSLAIEVLQTYLQKVPEDIAAHLQLAQLLLALGRQEVAREQLEKLHQQSPTNPLIQRLLLESGGKVREDLTMTFV